MVKHRKFYAVLLVLFLTAHGVSAQDASDDALSQERFSSPGAGGVILGIGGGYFAALGGESDYLDPSWSLRILAQNNNIGATLFGLGFDLFYSKLPDNEIDGSMSYISALTCATAVYPFYDGIMNLYAKAGPGITTLIAEVEGNRDISLSMTLSGGAGFYILLGGHYVLGAGAAYSYYFQRRSSASLDYSAYAGYRF